jgi:hypothetical protein
MASWGATEFKILWGSYAAPHTDDSVSIIDILADHTDLSSPAQVLQQGGRKRQQISFTVVEYPRPVDMTIYDTFQAGKDAGTVLEFSGPMGVTLDCAVLSVGRIDYQEGAIYYPVTLVEAVDL